MKKNLNQKLINLIEYYSLINSNLLISKTPIKTARFFIRTGFQSCFFLISTLTKTGLLAGYTREVS